MRVDKVHDDEADIDEALVRRLLASQMPQWAELPLRLIVPSGTDNVMVRLRCASMRSRPGVPNTVTIPGGSRAPRTPRSWHSRAIRA